MNERTKYDNALRRQVVSVPDLVLQTLPSIKASVRQFLDSMDTNQIHEIFITGCGDSFCAGRGTEGLFRAFTGIPTHAATAMELSRFYPCEFLSKRPSGTLLVAISNSGRVPRVTETVTRFDQYGAATLAFTANKNSPLAKAAQYQISTEIPSFERSPGVRGYVIALLTLTLLAIGIGLKRGRLSKADAQKHEHAMSSLFHSLAIALPAYDETAYQMAAQYISAPSCEFIGCGQGYGSAVFAREKMYEAVALPSTVCDSEEWFHSFRFLKDLDATPVMVFSEHSSPGASRTKEMLTRMALMKRAFALVTDDTEATADYLFRLPETNCPLLLPLCEFAAPGLLAAYLAAFRHEPYSRGFAGRWSDFEGAPSTVSSQVIVL